MEGMQFTARQSNKKNSQLSVIRYQLSVQDDPP